MANGVGKRTATAGTKIRVLALPSPYGYTRLNLISYTPGATSHTGTVLRAIGQTTAASAAGAGSSSFTLAGDPGPSGNGLAANDLVAVRETDGVTRVYKVTSYSGGTLTIGSDASGPSTLVAGVAVGSKVWNFGVESDTDPYTGFAHEAFPLPTGTTTVLSATNGFIGGHLPDSPVLFSVDNVTNQGTLNQMSWLVGSLGGVLVSSSDAAMSVGVF